LKDLKLLKDKVIAKDHSGNNDLLFNSEVTPYDAEVNNPLLKIQYIQSAN